MLSGEMFLIFGDMMEACGVPNNLIAIIIFWCRFLRYWRKGLVEDFKQQSFSGSYYPKGQLQLSTMRLADILSNDSNFRSFVTIPFASPARFWNLFRWRCWVTFVIVILGFLRRKTFCFVLKLTSIHFTRPPYPLTHSPIFCFFPIAKNFY